MCVQPPTQFRVPAPEAVEDRGGGYKLSGIARRFAPHFQQDPRAIVVSKGKKHPPSEPEPLEPQRLRVRRAGVDEDDVYSCDTRRRYLRQTTSRICLA
jgi:hypothetical protein